MSKKVTDIFPPSKKEKEIKIGKEDLSSSSATRAAAKGKEEESPSGLKTSTSQASILPLKKGLFISLFFLVLLGFFCYFTLSKAEIEIWPETEILTSEIKLTVDKEAKESDISAKIIPGEIFQKEKTLTEVFQSSGQVLKEEKAAGTIRIYNAYSTSPQALVATTRFVSSDGKVFRTPLKVTIPGGSYEKGKFVPGEIDIMVLADEAGPEYNIGPANFSVPGFAGTDKYTKFYGQSFQSMAGGFREEVSKVTKEDLTRAEDLLTEQAKKECEELLKNELQSEEISSKFNYFLAELRTEIIEKFSLAVAEEETKEFKFQVKARCENLLFQKEYLKSFAKESITEALAEVEKKESSSTIYQVPQDKKLYEESLKIDYSPETVDLASGKIILSLNISAKIYSEVDVYNLKNALVGKSLPEAKIFLENQPKIGKVSVKLWPFWVRKVPEDLNKIKINLVF